MVQTPGNVRSQDAVLGGEVLSFEITLSLIAANLGTIPIFVVPAGENYRVVAVRSLVTIALSQTTCTFKITDGSADITTALAIDPATVGGVELPTVLTTNDVDKLSFGDTLTVVTAGAGATAGEIYLRIDLVRTTGNM